MDSAYVDELAKDNNGVKYLQDLFDRTVDARRTETKDYREMVRALSNMIQERMDTRKFGSTRE